MDIRLAAAGLLLGCCIRHGHFARLSLVCMQDNEFSASTLDSRARRLVAWVAALNGLGFVVEVTVALVIGSAALFADAADFLEDTLINVLVLTALGWSVASRRKVSYTLAGRIVRWFRVLGWRRAMMLRLMC